MTRSFPTSSGLSPTEDESPAARLFQEHAPAIFADLRLRAARGTKTCCWRSLWRPWSMLRRWPSAPTRRSAPRYARPQILLEEVAETLFADETQTPAHTALQREQDDRLWALLEQLPRLPQQVICLRFVYDLSCAEIAEALGKREGAVRKQLWRTLKAYAQGARSIRSVRSITM
jgi:RNA polymerase sigma factor (sigma-70 family)